MTVQTIGMLISGIAALTVTLYMNMRRSMEIKNAEEERRRREHEEMSEIRNIYKSNMANLNNTNMVFNPVTCRYEIPTPVLGYPNPIQPNPPQPIIPPNPAWGMTFNPPEPRRSMMYSPPPVQQPDPFIQQMTYLDNGIKQFMMKDAQSNKPPQENMWNRQSPYKYGWDANTFKSSYESAIRL